MALVPCRECGKQISSEAVACPQCGCPAAASPTPQAPPTQPPAMPQSAPSTQVNVAGVDPFAEFHTPIKGKSKGNLTCVGYLGILMGALFMFVGILAMRAFGAAGSQNSFLICMLGFGFVIASYLWARSPAPPTQE